MKKVLLFLTIALASAAVSGCVQERDGQKAAPIVTISASMPEEAFTKAVFQLPESGPGLHVAWQSGDKIRVINAANPSNHAAYDIQAGFTDHQATFSGPAVNGNYYNIICPGTYTSVEAAEAGNPSLTQNGNNSPAHLVFTAMLGNVAKEDVTEITFSDDWVASHPGTTLNRGGVVKFILTLPNAVTAPVKVTMNGIGNEVSLNLKNISTSSNHQLIAYAPCGWTDVPIPAWTEIKIEVLNTDGTCYAATKTITTNDKVLKAGAVNVMTVSSASEFEEQLFAGGEGTQASPWLIATPKQLDNMHAVIDHQDKKFFRLIKDINMQSYLSSHAWIPLNMDSPYDRPVNLDGAGFTISNFKINTVDESNKQTGFFGVLYGEVYNLKFTNAVINNNYGLPTGILCGYCGYSGKMAHVYNVHINGSIEYSSGLSGANGNGPCGALAGRIHTCLIESCSAQNITIHSTKAFAGGLVGLDWAGGSVIRNCWTSGSVTSDGQRTGAICGSLIKTGTQIVNCFSTAEVHAPRGIGGIVGYSNMDSGAGKGYETNMPGYVVSGCIAWQSELKTNTYSADGTNNFWSSGAIVSGTSTHNNLRNCWRRADMDFRDYTGLLPGAYDQEDASPTNPLVVNNPDPTVFLNYYPYHGKAAGASETISAVAKRIGWSTKVWNLNGSVPVLTGEIEDTPSSGASSVPAGSAGSGPKRPSAGGSWEVSQIEPGITYYHYHNTNDSNYYDNGNTHQEAYVVDVDLSNEDYEVKIVYTSPAMTCSQVFEATGAIAAINGAYEQGSIVVKANADYIVDDNDNATLTSYSQGRGVTYMPNDFITDNNGKMVVNWKSHGAFYCDGHRGVRFAFDAYDGNVSPPVKSAQEMRSFYRMCTDNEPGLISSAPVLIENYNQFGKQFHNNWYASSTSSSSEDPHTHQRGLYPRTAVALTADNHLLLFVCDGRYSKSAGGTGMSANWVTKFLADNFNPQYALNLDGGGSSTMCVQGKGDNDTHVVNYPCDNMGSGTTHNHSGERARDSFIVIVPKDSF